MSASAAPEPIQVRRWEDVKALRHTFAAAYSEGEAHGIESQARKLVEMAEALKAAQDQNAALADEKERAIRWAVHLEGQNARYGRLLRLIDDLQRRASKGTTPEPAALAGISALLNPSGIRGES